MAGSLIGLLYESLSLQAFKDSFDNHSAVPSILRMHSSYDGEFKHEVRQFEKSYDNQQAEQISLMV